MTSLDLTWGNNSSGTDEWRLLAFNTLLFLDTVIPQFIIALLDARATARVSFLIHETTDRRKVKLLRASILPGANEGERLAFYIGGLLKNQFIDFAPNKVHQSPKASDVEESEGPTGPGAAELFTGIAGLLRGLGGLVDPIKSITKLVESIREGGEVNIEYEFTERVGDKPSTAKFTIKKTRAKAVEKALKALEAFSKKQDARVSTESAALKWEESEEAKEFIRAHPTD